MSSLKRVVIVGAVRTPIGAFGGQLSSLSAPQLASFAIRGALAQAKVPAKEVDEVFMGNVVSAGLGQSPSRQAALGAGLPYSVACTDVNKVCASGMKSVMLGAAAIRGGDAEVVVAGGMESMTNVPFYAPDMRNGKRYGDTKFVDGLANDGLRDAYSKRAMGDCGEICAKEESISRKEMDEFTFQSYSRAMAAQKAGKLKSEIVPVEIKDRKTGGTVTVTEDEAKAGTSLDKLSALKPVFNPALTITAGNASSMNDGASALVLMSEERALKNGLNILAVIRGYADGAVDPDHFPIAPAVSIPKALQNAGVKQNEVDFWEINEAFAVVPLALAKRMKIPSERLNVRGGAVSGLWGHALGSSGSRIMVSLINILHQENGKIGVCGICNGGGGSSAIVIEKYAGNNKSKM